MAHKDEISHSGRIIDIDQDITTVEIIASSACSSCHAKGMCGFSEDEEKILQLPTDPYGTWQKGDEVEVYTKKSMGLKAVWIAYIVPLVVLMVLILALAPVVEKEIMRGVYALGGVALYYLVVFLFRGRLANEIVFDIRKK
jgi:sigma-E factor negative regulatory protein RseC